MKRSLGDVRQIGLVVRDADAAMRYFIETLGIGPFFVAREVTFQDYRYYGEPTDSPVVTLGYAQAGELQIEVVQQHDDRPSGYRDFLASGREGLQHMSSWFGSKQDFDAAYAAATASGARVVHEGCAGGPRFAYLSTIGNSPIGVDFELAEGKLPEVEIVYRKLLDASRGWDGSDPIRPL